MPLWAVHIADGVLTTEWWASGFVAAAVLAALGAWRIRDEEIPRVALLTAAFFVASSFHIRVGPTSVHLLLNGLIGVILGPRACLAIPIGLWLQYLLIQHGGSSTIGINSCVMAVPALLAWLLFALLRRVPWSRRPWFRALLVGFCSVAWILSVIYSVTLLCTNGLRTVTALDTSSADSLTFHPLTLAGAVFAAVLLAYAERRLGNAPEFALGLLVGEVAVLATIALNCLVLLWGGEEDWLTPALIMVVAHLPIAAVEGVIVGFTVGFLAKVKPDMLGWTAPPPAAVPERENHATSLFAGAPPHHAPGLAGDAGPGPRSASPPAGR